MGLLGLEKLEMAQRLRDEAARIALLGATNHFEHTYACLRFGWSSQEREEARCGPLSGRRLVPQEYERETFPCQHLHRPGGLAGQYRSWLLHTAQELEAARRPRRRRGGPA